MWEIGPIFQNYKKVFENYKSEFLKFKFENYKKIWGAIENVESEIYFLKNGKWEM